MALQTHTLFDHILDAPMKLITGGAGGLLLAFAARFYLSGDVFLAIVAIGVAAIVIGQYVIRATYGAGMDRLGASMQDKLGRSGDERVEFTDQNHWTLRHMFALAGLGGFVVGMILNPYILLGLT